MTYRKTPLLRFGFALAAASLLTLAGCHGDAHPGVSVKRAWVRLPAVAGGAAAGYFTARSNLDDELVSVDAPSARVELHETMAQGAMTSMRPLAAARLPAGEKIAFA